MKNVKTRSEFLNEDKTQTIYAFDCSFHLNTTSDYVTSERKFGSDMLGVHGGDQFDFDVEHIYLSEDVYKNEEVTNVELDGTFKKPDGRDWNKSELTNALAEYIGDVVESYTKKYPQLFKVDISLYKP